MYPVSALESPSAPPGGKADGLIRYLLSGVPIGGIKRRTSARE